jgi:hypothetical protein
MSMLYDILQRFGYVTGMVTNSTKNSVGSIHHGTLLFCDLIQTTIGQLMSLNTLTF